MFKINRIKTNLTTLEDDTGILLISYETPVAYQDRATGKFYKTDKFWSKTTSKHIAQFIGRDRKKIEVVGQWFFDHCYNMAKSGEGLSRIVPVERGEADGK